MIELFDTHAHLNDPSLLKLGAGLFESAAEAQVTRMMAIGIDLKSSLQCVEIAEKNEHVFASAGVHPNSSHQCNEHRWKEVLELFKRPKVVAIGECGLDCYWDDCPLDIQKQWFVKQIVLSHENGLPLVVHMRESEQEILDAFAGNHDSGKVHGIMHSFTGSWETAQTCLDYGMYISFAGMVTFKNAQAIRDVAKQVPADRILIETDAPYLTPEPHRGKRPNHPALVQHTAQCLADLRGQSLEEFAAQTTANALRVFKFADDSI